MKKIPFNKITTKQELITRVEDNGDLSVGNKIKHIIKFLDKKPQGNNYIKVNVISNSMENESGLKVQEMFINIKEKTNEEKVDEVLKKLGIFEDAKRLENIILSVYSKSERYSFAN